MSRSRVPLLLATSVAALMVECASGGLAGDGLLCLAPALLLICILFGRRYPGERLLARLAARGHEARSRPTDAHRAPRMSAVPMPRGGLLMGFAMAVRPPPASPAAS